MVPAVLRVVHVNPSLDVTIVAFPLLPPPPPNAINNEPFQTISKPALLKTVLPRPVHVNPPSVDVAIELPVVSTPPTATNNPRPRSAITFSDPLIVVLERIEGPVTVSAASL